MAKEYNSRVVSIYIIFLFLFLILAAKIIYLQVFKSIFFQNLARSQHYRILRLEGGRGDIFDCRGRTLATGINCYSVFADPLLVSDPAGLPAALSADLELNTERILLDLQKKKRFVWIKRKVSLADREKIRSLNLKGVGFLRDKQRFYPQGPLAASVIGIVDIDNKGLEGIELFYDDYLRGKAGWVRVLQDSGSREIILSSQVITPQRGTDTVLTLDAQIQYWTENSLKDTIQKFGAKKGSAVVMDAATGAVLALANYPSFDPNHPGESGPEDIKNNAICDMFEPGSVFKVVALLAALNAKSFSDTDRIFCENGTFKIPGSVLHDWRAYGELTFEEVFIKSSNIGVAKIVNSTGLDNYFRMIKQLGFGELTGIDLPGEVRGSIKPVSSWSKTSGYIIPIGQEIGVNLIQLVRVFGAVANGGYLVQPHILKNICAYGFCKDFPLQKKRVLSPEVARRAKDILVAVVAEGTGKLAGVKGRVIGGKTGTAQKYDPAIKKYSPSKYRATFVGFIADLNPPLVIGISIDEPQKSHFGGVVAAPAFRDIAQKAIKYLEGESS